MNITITARHFKAHESLRSYAFDAVNKLEQYFDGIISAAMVLSFEKSKKSVKSAELILKVQGAVLKTMVSTDDFPKSIDGAAIKMERQLQKHKAKVREKKKAVIRTKRAKV